MPHPSAAQRLAHFLGRPVDELRALEALSEAQVEVFHDVIDETKLRQSAALAAAIDASLEHIPAVLRGPVKRMLGIPA